MYNVNVDDMLVYQETMPLLGEQAVAYRGLALARGLWCGINYLYKLHTQA